MSTKDDARQEQEQEDNNNRAPKLFNVSASQIVPYQDDWDELVTAQEEERTVAQGLIAEALKEADKAKKADKPLAMLNVIALQNNQIVLGQAHQEARDEWLCELNLTAMSADVWSRVGNQKGAQFTMKSIGMQVASIADKVGAGEGTAAPAQRSERANARRQRRAG